MDTSTVNAKDMFAPFQHVALLREHSMMYFISVRLCGVSTENSAYLKH